MFYREAGDPAAPTLLLVSIAAVGVVFTVDELGAQSPGLLGGSLPGCRALVAQPAGAVVRGQVAQLCDWRFGQVRQLAQFGLLERQRPAAGGGVRAVPGGGRP